MVTEDEYGLVAKSGGSVSAFGGNTKEVGGMSAGFGKTGISTAIGGGGGAIVAETTGGYDGRRRKNQMNSKFHVNFD